MRSYELTDRGKIIIAVVLVVVLLVIPSIIILAVSSCSDTSPPGDDPSVSQTPDNDHLTIQDTPLPTPGSGFDPSSPDVQDPTDIPDLPPDEPATDETPAPTPTPTPLPTPSPSPPPEDGFGGSEAIHEYGPVGLNLAEGTMLFIYSPDLQETLDEETVEMLGDFLSSPKNTQNSMVKVDIPHVGSDDEAMLITAVGEAFSRYNITEDGLVYEMGSSSADGRYFEIALSYTPIPTRVK